jgi:two-component system, cell cycle response regulator
MEHELVTRVRKILAEPNTGTGADTLDELTGVYSVGFGVRRLAEETERALRYQHALSCIVLDLDRLQAVNAEHGPARGDRVLQDVGTILRHAARPSDIVCRLGGGQFLLITPRVDAPAAQAQAERFRQRVARHRFPVPGGTALSLTASCGVATVGGEITCPEALVACALEALVRAKLAGGDRTVVG